MVPNFVFLLDTGQPCRTIEIKDQKMWVEVSFVGGWVKISYEYLRHKETESILLTPEIERVFTSICTNSRNEFS